MPFSSELPEAAKYSTSSYDGCLIFQAKTTVKILQEENKVTEWSFDWVNKVLASEISVKTINDVKVLEHLQDSWKIFQMVRAFLKEVNLA